MGGKNAKNNISRNTPIMREKYVGEKIVGKSAKTRFLYSHEYRDQKMGRKERAKQFFQKHTNSTSEKCWEKNRRKKVRKIFFLIYTNIVTKKGGKTRETIFPEKTPIVRAKNVRKKSSKKSAKKRFL